MFRTFACVAFILALTSTVRGQATDKLPAKLPVVQCDPLPQGAERRLGTNRLRLPNRVGYFMFSPDDSTLMVGSGSHVYFWDTKTWRETWQLSAIAFTCSPDGVHVARKTGDFQIEIWDVKKQKLVQTRDLSRLPRPGRIFDLEFNDKGNLLWLGISRQGVCLYDWAAGKVVTRLEIPDINEFSLLHSRDRNAFLLQRQTGQYLVYDGAGKLVREIKPGADKQNETPFFWSSLNHDGKIFAANDYTHTFKFWEVASGKPITPLPELPKRDEAPRGGDDDAPFGLEDPLYDRRRALTRIVFDSKGTHLLVTGEKTLVVDIAKKAIVAEATLPGLFPMAYAISNDNSMLAIGYEDGSVEIRDPRTLQPLIADPYPRGPALGLAFSRDGKTLATFHGNKTGVRLWDPKDGRVLRSFDIDVLQVRTLPPLSFADNDRRLALGAAYSWKTATGEPLPTKQRKDRAIAASLDGSRWLFSKENDQGEVAEIAVDDLVAGREVMKLPLDLAADTTVLNYYLRSAISDDGGAVALHKRLANKRDPNTGDMRTLEDAITVWNIRGPRPEPIFSTLCRRVPSAIDLSPTANFLAVQGEPSADRPHQLWHLSTGFTLWKATSDPTPKAAPRRMPSSEEDMLLDLDDFRGSYYEVEPTGVLTFSPDSQFLAASTTGGVLVREALSGAPLMTFKGQAGRLGALAFSPDGRRLASATSDSTIIFWNTPPFASAKPGNWKRDSFETLWTNLRGEATLAYQAMADLHAGGDEAVALLKDKIRPESDEERRLIVQTLADLAAPSFRTREKASAELEKWGFRLKPYLTTAIAQSTDLEQKRRLISVLERSRSTGIDPDELRLNRAAFLLERIGTPAARVVLENLAHGHANDLTAQTARGALVRLQRAAAKTQS